MVTKIGLDDFLRKIGRRHKLLLYTRPAEVVQAEDPFLTLPLTDVGNAARLAHFAEDRGVWCDDSQMWSIWNEVFWDGRSSQAIWALAIETVREFQARAKALPDTESRKEQLVKYATSLERRSKLRDMIELAKHLMEVRFAAFDRDPHLLNCPNGTVDLQTGALKPHDPADMITKVAGFDYRPGFRHPVWDTFIQETTAGKEGLESFIQEAVGYSATGLTIEEKMFMVIGPTRTGKSTAVEAWKTALGDYAVTANFETFLQQRNGSGDSGPSEGLARLAGARFVSSSEVDDGRRLAIATTKQLTGGDAITARFLYKGSFTYKPQFALWLVANTEPLVSKDEQAMWERVLRVPLDNEVPPEARDPTLKAKLQDPDEAGPAVLNWIVEGAVRWYAMKKLVVPQVVIFSTNDYRERMDRLAAFIEDMCVEGPYEKVTTVELQKAYVRWCKDVGEKAPLGRTQFNKALENRGLEKKRKTGSGSQEWVGLGMQLKPGGDSGDFSGDFGGSVS